VLKGLLIRQGFRVLDLVLVGLMVYVAFAAVRQALWTPADRADDVDAGGYDDTGGLPDLNTHVGPRTEYDAIVANRLFGEAANRATPKPPETPGPEKDELVDAPPELRLWGTATGFPTDPLGSAVIENAAAKTVQKIDTYFIGDHVTAQHILVEIYPRRAILRNTAKNRREELVLRDDAAPTAVAGAPGADRVRRPTPGRANYARVNRAYALEEFTTRGVELVQEAKPEMYFDEDGNIAGITSRNLSKIPLAQQVGLQDGDVVQAVNGVAINSEDSIPEIFSRFENAMTFRLSVLRNGKTQMLNIQLE
jgi:hypothetical protein